MHNESQADRESTEPAKPVKPSKLARIKSSAVTAAWIVIPVALTGGSMYLSWKLTATQLETAKLNLETAKLKHS